MIIFNILIFLLYFVWGVRFNKRIWRLKAEKEKLLEKLDIPFPDVEDEVKLRDIEQCIVDYTAIVLACILGMILICVSFLFCF